MHLPVRSIRRLQRVEHHFGKAVAPTETIKTIYGMMQHELNGELDEAIKSGDIKEMMSEIGDVVILAGRFADLAGFSLHDAVNGKIRRNEVKYNARKLRRLRRDWGYTYEEAMAFAKDHWDRDRDKKFL